MTLQSLSQSRPSFFLVEPNFPFSLVVFCSHAAFLLSFSVVFSFLFFHFFVYFFFGNGFLNSLIVRSKSCLSYVNETSLNCTSGLVLLCFFYFVVNIFVTTI